MSDTGTFKTSIAVESLDRRGERADLTSVLVDTGSELTWMPTEVLESIGVRRVRVQRFRQADGSTLERATGFAVLHVAGVSTADDVVFASDGDMTVLGARTMEGLNLRVDPREKRLVSAGPMPATTLLKDQVAVQPLARSG